MLTDGFWGFIGVITGSILTLFSHFIFEMCRKKDKNRKLFIKQHYKISENIFKIKSALKQIQNFADMDINLCANNDLSEEYYPSLIHFSKECSDIWNDFRIMLMRYFFRSINKNSLLILNDTILNIIDINGGLSNTINFEILENHHCTLKNKKDNILESLKTMDSIEIQYQKLINKLIRKYI
jgi:hypothetical protein